MKKYQAHIDVMPREELLDPQGKVVVTGLARLGISEVKQARVGKHLRLIIEADSEENARAQVEEACRKLLANPVMEDYAITLHESA